MEDGGAEWELPVTLQGAGGGEAAADLHDSPASWDGASTAPLPRGTEAGSGKHPLKGQGDDTDTPTVSVILGAAQELIKRAWAEASASSELDLVRRDDEGQDDAVEDAHSKRTKDDKLLRDVVAWTSEFAANAELNGSSTASPAVVSMLLGLLQAGLAPVCSVLGHRSEDGHSHVTSPAHSILAGDSDSVTELSRLNEYLRSGSPAELVLRTVVDTLVGGGSNPWGRCPPNSELLRAAFFAACIAVPVTEGKRSCSPVL